MRTLRSTLAIALLCVSAAAAKADDFDFQVVVIDPPPSNLIPPLTSDSFAFSLVSSGPGDLQSNPGTRLAAAARHRHSVRSRTGVRRLAAANPSSPLPIVLPT